jgi:ribose transport system permease protein
VSAAPTTTTPAPAKPQSHRLHDLVHAEKVPVPALAVLILITLVMLLVNPSFLSLGNLSTLAVQSAVPVVLAVGLTFVVLMGGIDLSLEGVMAASGMATAVLLLNDRNGFDLGLWAVAVAVALGAALGALSGFSVAFLRVPSFIVTIGTWQIGLGIALLLFAGKPPRIQDAGFLRLAVNPVFGLPLLVWTAVAVVLIGAWIQHYSRFGRYVMVVGGGEDIARLSGIPVRRIRVYGFIVSGFCAGLAGALATARTGVGDVGIGTGQLFITIAGVVIGGTVLTGGRGGVLHSVVGVIVMVALANGMVLAGVSSFIQQAVLGAIVVAAAVTTMWRLRARLRVVK